MAAIELNNIPPHMAETLHTQEVHLSVKYAGGGHTMRITRAKAQTLEEATLKALIEARIVLEQAVAEINSRIEAQVAELILKRNEPKIDSE